MNILHLVLLMVINMIDYLMFYLLGSKLVNERVAISFKKSDNKMITFGLGYTIAIGGIAYIVMYNSVDLYIFRIITIISLIFVAKFASKQSLLNSFLIFIIAYLICLFFQTFLSILLTNLLLNDYYISLAIQVSTLIITTFLYLKIPIHYFYGLVEQNILLKFIIYITMILSTALLFYINYDYSADGIFYFLFIFSLTVTAISIEVVRIFSSYRKQITENLHDTKNLIGGVHMTAHSTSDIAAIRKNLDECIELLQLQNSVLDTFEINQEKENILLFIQQKKDEYKKPLEIISQIDYIDGHEKIPLGIIIYMLGTLLDNAIEYTVQHMIKHKPILIELLIMDDTVEIHVSNPYKREVTEEFKKAFEKGYSIKSSHQRGREKRGFGLSNLKRVIRKYDGIIYYGSKYHAEHEYTYLTITIEISCYSPWKGQELEKSNNYGDRTLFLVKTK